ncbi:membrane protein DedA with SNARE-associated domain [Deinobacterium chartae]|uniref:Membrane protein DedA with SNARE-associated domain n=1 Tax=Deinobacterium chartae TaxID=521158 RepID=A0A841I2Q5_9DEIO|nr:DedA family protein [Deinobacterium chartae]MBB6100101.1 membrane protein DedA with SNARE-associated domain [Deinobacterium chartae]
MAEWISGLMESMGYLGIVFLMFLENVFPPIPSELIMPLAGFTAGQGKLSLIGVILAGTLGSVLGALPLYALGRWVGEEKLKRWADRYGKWLTVSAQEIEKADDWFDRHGHKTVLIARVIPAVRSLISIPAGLSEMPLPKFLIYTSLGTAVWSAALALLGNLLGENYETVERFIDPLSYVVVAGIVIFTVVWIVRRHRARAAQDRHGHSDS